MGIISIGHRLTILKGVYDIKIKQEIPIDSDHWIPPCKFDRRLFRQETFSLCTLAADAETRDSTATKDDVSRIIESMRIRDIRIQAAESELRKMTEEYRKLRDELLPIFRMAKERQPLPYHPNSHSPDHPDDGTLVSSQLPMEPKSSGLSRKFSTKRLFLGSTPKSSSPTHIPQSIPEGRSMADTNLDPSAAANAASNLLTAQSMNGGSQPLNSPNQANVPSPTSPNTYANQPTLHQRTYRGDQQTPQTARQTYSHAEDPYSSSVSTFTSERDPRNPTPTPGAGSRYAQQQRPQQQDDPPPSGGSTRDAPSVEIFKSFRVSMEDPCEKVLPAALKKYNINADWKNYALYIVYGDQERCLGLREKPLILFKQLDKDGKKPMFMLRRHAAPMEGHSGPSGGGGMGGGAGYDPNMGLGSGRGHQSSIQLPGGVL